VDKGDLHAREDIMPASSTTRFGKLLRDFRKRAGLSPSKLASYLNEDVQLIKELEAGRSEPPSDPVFYERLQAVPEFTELDITLLLEAAEAEKFSDDLVKLLAIVLKDSAKLRVYRHRKELQGDDQRLPLVRQALVGKEAAQVALTKHFPKDTAGLAIMPAQSPSTTLDFSPNIEVTPEIPVPYSHTSVPDHAPQIIKEGKLQPSNKQDQSPQALIKAIERRREKRGT
jgi:transcriptional regulator with XRE-family HTH domain